MDITTHASVLRSLAAGAQANAYGGVSPFVIHFITSGILAMIAVCAAVFLVLKLWARIRRRPWLRRGAYAVLALSLIPIRPFAAALWLQYKWPVIIICALLTGTHLRLKRAGGPGLFQRKYLLWAIVLFPVIVSFTIVRQYAFEADNCGRLAMDRRITPLFSLCRDGWRERIVRAEPHGAPPAPEIAQDPRTIFPSADGRSVYCALGYQDLEYKQPLMKIRRRDNKIQKVYYLYSPFRGECAPGQGRCFVVSPMKRGLLEIDDEKNEISREVRLRNYVPLFLGLDTARKQVLMTPMYNRRLVDTSEDVVNETVARRTLTPPHRAVRAAERESGGLIGLPHARVWVYDWGEGRAWGLEQTGDFPMSHGLTHYSEELETLYAVNGIISWNVFAGRRPHLQMKGASIGLFNFLMGLGVGNGIAADAEGAQFFTGMPMHGAVYVFDARENRYKRRINLEIGVRDLAFDPERRALFAAGYLTGHVFVISADTYKVVDKIFVGRKVRHIHWDARARRLLVTSANGCLEVDPFLSGQ
jgi:hypothetical protein